MDFEIRENRGRPSGKRLVRERAAYFQLMEQGYSTREAARIVGINLRTGKRWRNGWHSPPGGKKAGSSCPARGGTGFRPVPIPQRDRAHPHRRPAA
ncbi:helix-turn-helix domain-containing protein [Streptomyces sp. NPDC004680]|uniref:helix-turn-helix domain-containing protein n=1 Tax=Streptomyces sp. NPDC004680 TaxID=3154287 RepID=UPI0033BE194F